MIQITQKDINKAGGLLSALSIKSSEYIHNIINVDTTDKTNTNIGNLNSTIVHTDPHLDEYFAELLFRACLPEKKKNINFVEQSIFSIANDLACQYLWPNAAVFGIGGAASGGAKALFLFDEHLAERGKIAPSSSQIVADKFLKSIPESISTVLQEVNAIDEYGKAHPQNLGNIIKILHEVDFLFDKGITSVDDKRSSLSFFWKRAIINASLTAIVSCLINDIDLVGEPNLKKKFIQESIQKYANSSLHKEHPKFKEALQSISSNYGNVKGTFKDAILKDRNNKPIRNSSGNSIPQLLILPRVCFALHHCWEKDIAEAIMVHFWEVEFQKQLNFLTVQEELQKVFNKSGNHFVTSVGTIRKKILGEIYVEHTMYEKGKRKFFKGKTPLWLISFSPIKSIFHSNQPILYYINKHNHGCGIVLLENTFIGTKALFKTQSIPEYKWTKLVRKIQSKEINIMDRNKKTIWYDPSSDPNKAAPFIVNGNKAHQYVPMSVLDISILAELVKESFF